MSNNMPNECRKVQAGETYAGKQGFEYFSGISKESTGAQGICMHLLTVPEGGRAKAHKHATHETAIYTLQGEGTMYWGERLENKMVAAAGELVYIPANVPHLPINTGRGELKAIIARTDPNEQESVVLLPELERFVPYS